MKKLIRIKRGPRGEYELSQIENEIQKYREVLSRDGKLSPETAKRIRNAYDALFGNHHGRTQIWLDEDGKELLKGSDSFVAMLYQGILSDIEAIHEFYEGWLRPAEDEDYDAFVEETKEARALIEGLDIPSGKYGHTDPADKLGHIFTKTPINMAIEITCHTLKTSFGMDYTPESLRKKIAKYPA
jgi:hypothetical protein